MDMYKTANLCASELIDDYKMFGLPNSKRDNKINIKVRVNSYSSNEGFKEYEITEICEMVRIKIFNSAEIDKLISEKNKYHIRISKEELFGE